jgi:hypothetical protein
MCIPVYDPATLRGAGLPPSRNPFLKHNKRDATKAENFNLKASKETDLEVQKYMNITQNKNTVRYLYSCGLCAFEAV